MKFDREILLGYNKKTVWGGGHLVEKPLSFRLEYKYMGGDLID